MVSRTLASNVVGRPTQINADEFQRVEEAYDPLIQLTAWLPPMSVHYR